MPHKKPHNSNKKKGKNKGRNINSTASRPSSSRPTSYPHLRALENIGNDLTSFRSSQTIQSDEQPAVGGYYEAYKASTTRFWEWMKQQKLTNNKMAAVNDLRKGCDEILEQTVAVLDKDQLPADMTIVPLNILANLDTAIHYRHLFASARFGTSDEGHRHMIEVLKYCRSVLKFSRGVARFILKKQLTEEEDLDEQVDRVGGRFSAFLAIMEDDDEEESDEEDAQAAENDIRNRNFPVYSGPDVEEDIDIQEVLINGDDRFQAMALLFTADELMGLVDSHYGFLKNYMRGRGEAQHHDSSLQLLLESTVAANMATQSIQMAETLLTANHPHLSSFYHVLALVFLPPLVADVETLFANKSQDKPHLALQFVADITEVSFHNRGDKLLSPVVSRYAKQLKLSHTVVEEEALKIFRVVSTESMIAMEEKLQPARTLAQLRLAGISSHAWLRQSPYIGGDRSILNTQKIVQMMMDVLRDTNTRLVGKCGFWGDHYDENRNSAKKIRGDLDEPFGSAIMPDLLELCRFAPFQSLPDRHELITVLNLLQEHVRGERTKPVSLALSFGLHALLTSIYILQGDGDLARLASHTKTSFNTLFDQFDIISDSSKPPRNAPSFYRNMILWKNIRNFAKPLESNIENGVSAVDPRYAEKLALWNPLIGGEFLLYATYNCSIGLGSATVDSLGQLRFTLHLYNGLKQKEPSLGEVSFLHRLDKAFATTRAVWVGGRPAKGSFCKSFWMAWGMSANAASELASSRRAADERSFRAGFRDSPPGVRKLDEILPEEFSVSYKRIIQHDFDDEEGQARYTVQNVPEGFKNRDGFVDTLTRVNATRDSMDNDEDCVLPINFSAVGCILLEFVNVLADELGWADFISKELVANPQVRTGRTMAGNRLRGFTASDLNFHIQGIAHFWGHILSLLDTNYTSDSPLFDVDKVTLTMKTFFENVDRDRYTFFVEVEEAPRRRNPLEGSYPYGRTGRSVHDPLQAILHFKYNKRGKESVRVVTPGKLAPPVVAEPIPYQGQFKLIRGPSGTYRHIASYSLDELIELGWDGSMYVSSRARHAANGHYVPFIAGYDSDSDDEYEPIDMQRGYREGTIGLSRDQVGLYMLIPEEGIVEIKDPKGRGRR